MHSGASISTDTRFDSHLEIDERDAETAAAVVTFGRRRQHGLTVPHSAT